MKDEKIESVIHRMMNSIPFILPPSSLILSLRRALRGKIDARTLALEMWRRSRVSVERRRERALLEQIGESTALLRPEYARLPISELLEHFRNRATPKFLPGFNAPMLAMAELQRELFPKETAQLLEKAAHISDEHRWALLGYGEKFYGEEINWRRDPVSGAEWPLEYHAELRIVRGDNSDVRVLWELNRLAHLITLGRAYAVTNEERFAVEFFAQLESWRAQNPPARGANWACAMEVALRAMNLVAAFQFFRRSSQLNEKRLVELLAIFWQHGAHIRRNLEFSYIVTSNHYLSDVVGLLWIGIMLPELEEASLWREFALREMLREMDKQVLADGADAEASTAYHRLVLELFLYSFVLCRANDLRIDEKYWRKLHAMLEYVRAYLRPDGRAPLIGDTDSGQILPLTSRAGDDHAYVLAIGAAIFKESSFKRAAGNAPEELLWILGEQGVRDYENLAEEKEGATSQAFTNAGVYVMREDDLYLLFNASGCGLDGRGSHGHNDALSLEVSACGSAFIVDPGTYVYTSDLRERHLFRSTAYHSTIEVDDAEQNTTNEETPFVIGDEARPRVLNWDVTLERDLIIAEHRGYARLPAPVTHRRAVEFNKRERYWIVEDALLGMGEHTFRFRFHMASGLETSVRADGILQACDKMRRARLFIAPLDMDERPTLEPRFTSRDYGAKTESVAACWTLRAHAPLIIRWAIIPACANEDAETRLKLIKRSAVSHQLKHYHLRYMLNDFVARGNMIKS